MSGPRKVHLTEDTARRIGAATLAYERGNRDQPPIYFRTAVGDDGGLRIGKVSSDWEFGTCATVALWARGETGCTPAQVYPTETIEDVTNLSHDVPSGSWVVIGEAVDGKWYLLESGKDESSCRKTIGGQDITKWSGWDGTKVQLLGHDANGCLKWFDSDECPETSPGAP
jgi:hypothetical protein